MKSIKKFKTIAQVAENLKLPQHVLRFWENRFKQLKPLKLSGNRRYYREIDIELIGYIKNLLYEDCISIKGVQKIFGNQSINQILKSKNPILKEKNVAEYKIATLFYKPSMYREKFTLDYTGIEIPNEFIVGYGLDYDGLGRNLTSVYKRKS